MKREEIESRLEGALNESKARIQSAPLLYCCVGLVAGILIGSFPRFSVSIIAIAAIIIGILWLFGDVEHSGAGDTKRGTGERKGTVNGSGRADTKNTSGNQPGPDA